MSGALRSELLKLRTTRTFYGIVLAALGLTALLAGAAAGIAPYESGDVPGADIIDAAGLTQPFALVLGILAVSTEFRHGTITPTILAVPDRVRLMTAKLAAHGIAGLVLGGVSYVFAALLVVFVLPLRDIEPAISVGDSIEMMAGGVLCVALLAAIGVGVGALVRNQVGAVIAGLSYMFMVEPLLTALPKVGDEIDKYGIGGAINALTETTFAGIEVELSQPAGAALLIGYAVLFALAAVAALRARDITA
jgi:ABC-2 type transport system permease protein